MGNDTTVMSFEINFGKSTENFNSLISAGNKLNETITDIRKNATAVLPETSSQFDDATKNINDTLQSMSLVNKQIKSGKLDSYQADIKTQEFNNLAKSLSAIIADMQTVQRLTASIGKQTTAYTQKQMKTLMPQLMGMARDATRVYAQSGSLASDEQILASIKATQRYQTMRSNLLGNNKSGNIDDILRLAIVRGVGQTQRASFMNRIATGNSLTKHVFDSFQDMLPSGFKKINTSNQNISSALFSKNLQSNMQSLSAKEAQSLYSLLLNNQFATEAAEAAKIAYRKNGELFIQKNVSRGMVKAMGAHIYDNLVNSAKGMGMYGVTDVNDPAFWDKIARKSNKRLMGNMSAARQLSDAYDWFEAERYSQKDFKKLASNKRTMFSAGRINFSPNPNSYEVAMYTLDDIQKNRNWNDRKKYSNYKDYHHIAVDESMHLNTIMRYSKGGIKKHNSYLDDVLYLEIDPRLGDPNLSQAERQALIDQYAEVFKNGISGKGKNSLNENYVLSRINPKMGAEFIRKSVYNKIKKEDPTYFSAGLSRTEFDDWKTFAASMEYRNKNATPGKSIQQLFGSELPKNIVVVDLEDTTKGGKGAGLNGASVISNRLVQKGFQGRAHGIKTALTSVDIDQLVDAYGDQLYLTAFTGQEGEKGKRIKINKGVDMIVNAADLKNANTRFAGMSNAEITSIVQKDIQKGIYANKLYSDANGKTRWISGQLAQTLDIDKNSSMMFARSFMDHYRKLDDYNYAMKYLFSEGETHDLLEKHPELFGSRLIQNRISDYRQAIMARMLRGDLMLPEDVNAYKGMVAPWLIDAFNADMQTKHKNETVSAFSQLPQNIQDKLNKLTLGENRVLFQKTLATKLGLGRYPATAQSMQSVMNANSDENIAKFAEAIGLDPYGLYISTTSPLMELLQGADFDGDIMEIIELATNEKKNASVAKIMDKIVTATVKRNKKLYDAGQISEDELKRRDKILERTKSHGNSFSTDFSTAKGARSASVWTSEYALQSSNLGTPHATIRNAFQLTPDSEIALAMIDADKQYNINSTEGKKGVGRNTSSQQLSIIGKYKPFSEWYHMVDKSRDDYGNIDPNELRKHNFFGINLPSASMSGNMRAQNLTRFIAKNLYGYDINAGYNWDEILKTAHGDIDTDTAVGRMQQGLLDTMLGVVNADFLAPSDTTVAQLLQLKARAQEEEEKRVREERNQGLLKGNDIKRSDSAIAKTRLFSLGGNAIDNLVSYALTQNSSILSGNRDMFGQLNHLGIKNLIGHIDLSKYISGEVMSPEALKQEAEAKRMLQQNDILSQIATFDEETRKKKIDQLVFSPSLLSSLMKNPAGWAAHYFGAQEQDITPYTHLGWATHGAIEGFMRKRLTKNTQENPTQMTDDELAQAAQEAANDFEKYFDENVGKKGLSKSDVNKLKKTESYKNIKQYLSSHLTELFPEKDYEVVGIEGATSASEENYPLHFKFGKKINKNEKDEEEDVSSKGFFDLLVRSRNTGKYSIGDFKNYPHPTGHDRSMWQMQMLLYAGALQDYLGEKSLAPGDLEGLHIIEPIFNKTSKINSSPEAISSALEKGQEATKLIQSLATSGFQMEQISAVSKLIDDMFGNSASNNINNMIQEEQNRLEHMQTQIGSNAGEGVGAALVMHDEYNKAMQAISGINSFIWKNDPTKRDMRGNAWHRSYEQLAMQQGVIYDLENSNMHIQADMLTDQLDRTRLSLDTLLPRAAVQNLQDAYDLLKGINSEEVSSKKANSKVEEFKNLTTQIEAASDAYDVLQDKLKANKFELKQKKSELKGTEDEAARVRISNEIADIENQNEFYAEASKKASALKSKLNSEKKRYLTKNETDTWNELTQRQEALRLVSEGEKTSNITSIADEMSSYIKSVKQLKADTELYAKEFGIDQTSDTYTNYMKELNDLISVSAMTKFRNRSINNSLNEFESRRSGIAGNVSGMGLSDDEQIDYAVKMQTDKIAQEKANIEAKYKNMVLTKEQEAEKQRLLDYYDRYNENDYREQLLEARNMLKNRQDVQLQQFLRQGNQLTRRGLRSRTGFVARALDIRDANLSQWENRKLGIDEQIARKEKELADLEGQGKTFGDSNYNKTASDLDALREASVQAGNAIQSLSDPMSTAMAITEQFGEVVSRLAMRLGRQIFQKALQETKRFIKEFDSSMNEIQTITLKSDKDMQSIRSQTINKALGLRTSVSNVAGVESALYRQGLSDAEVSSRTESIIKFATVTKLNVQEATKIITTALQNDLVKSADEAMDALVALGDNAATTAAEIGKGMQKAAASAKVAGVSYAELTALLTIGTSDTQLSGTQVGTALQTVFSRMRRLSLSGFVADQNGEKTTTGNAEAALKAVGIDLWDNKALGKMRSAYEVLSDLSKVWQNLSDAQKNIVMNAMAGTRQTNVFSTLMEGMSEDNGATLDKYLGLATESEGVTQSKYEIAIQSLSAAMDELKSSWDSLVESFVVGGNITDSLNGFSDFLQTLSSISSKAGSIGNGIGIITAAVGALVATLIGVSGPIGWILTGIGALAGYVSGAGISASINSLFNPESETDKIAKENQKKLSNISSTRSVNEAIISDTNKAIEQVEKAGKAWEELNSSENTDNLRISLQNLANVFPDISASVDEAIKHLKNWTDVVDEAKNKVDDFSSGADKEIIDKTKDYIKNNLYGDYLTYSEQNIATTEGATNAKENLAAWYYTRGGSTLYRKNKSLFYNPFAVTLDVEKLYNEGTNEEKAIALTEAFRNYSEFRKYASPFLGSGLIETLNDKTNEKPYTSDSFVEYASAAFNKIIEKSNATESTLSDYSLKKEESRKFLRQKLPEILADDFALMVNDRFNLEDIETLFMRALDDEILHNESIIEDNGDYNEAAVENFVVSFLDGWLNDKSNFLNKILSQHSKYTDFKYHFSEADSDTWFNDYEKAVEYGISNNLNLADLKDSSGNTAYQTADKLIAAKIQEANLNNEQVALNKILYGQLYGEDVVSMAKSRIGNKLDNETDENYRRRLGKAMANISNGLPQGISSYPSFSEFKEAYQNAGLDASLANAIYQNPIALLGFLNEDLGLISSGLSQGINGELTASENAAAIQSVLNLISGDSDTVAKIFSDEIPGAYKALQSYFGDNTNDILNSLRNGTYKNSNYEKFVQRTLAEKGIKSGIGKEFTNTEVASMAKRVLARGDWTAALSEFENWDTDNWSVLKNKYPDLERYLSMTKEQQGSIEGQNLLRNIQIQFSVAGLSDLEEAQQIIEGTTNAVERLQKGGTIAFSTLNEFANKAFSEGQQSAKLNYGTEAEQDEIAMSLLGLSRVQYYSDRGKYLSLARTYDSGNRSTWANTWTEMYNNAPDEYKAVIREIAESQGYKFTESAYYGSNGRTTTGSFADNGIPQIAGLDFNSANRAARTAYLSSNKTGYAANALYEALFGIDGITRENIENVFNSEEGKKNWEELINAAPELTEEFRKMGHSLTEDGGIDWSSIEAEENGLDNALADLIAIIVKHTTDYQDAIYNTRSDIYNQAQKYLNGSDSADDYNAYASIVGSDIAARYRADNVTLTPQEQEYAQMLLDNYGKGIVGLTTSQKAAGAQSILDLISREKIEGYEQTYGNASQEMISAYVDAIPGMREYIDALQEGTKDEEALAKMAKDVQAEIDGIVASSKGYGEAATKAGEYAKAISKGGTAASKAKISVDAEMKAIQDRQTAIEKAAGKSGKELKKMSGSGDKTLEIFSGMFDYSPEQIANMSKEKIQELVNEAGPMIAEQYDTIVDAFYNALPEGTDVNLPIADLIHVHADGSVDLSDLEAVLGKASANIIAQIMSLAKEYGAIDLEAEFKNKTLTIAGLFRAISGAGVKAGKGYSGGGGGGGGGGKSEIDKLLEKQKHDIAAIQHNLNMLQTLGQTYDFTNNYQAQLTNIDQQIAAQEQLRAAYASNIAELEAQLATVESGSDDWYKLTEAIYSAQEAMAGITNTINQLRSSKITVIEQKQEYESGPKNHKGTILQARAQRYQTKDQFEAYVTTTNESIKNDQSRLDQNNEQIQEWESLLKQTIKKSDDWYKIRDKIWKKKEENEQIQNDIITAQIDLEKAKIDQIAADLENTNRNSEHLNNVLSTYSGMYESSSNFDKYREALETQSENLKKMKTANSKAIAEMKKQIEGMAEDDPARQYAIETLYQLEETQAQIEASLFENQASIEQSYISQIDKLYEQREKANEHESKLLDSALNKYERENDFVNANNIYLEKIRNTEEALTNYQLKLDDYLTLMNSGQIEEGSQAWFDLQDAINSTTESIAELENTAEDLVNKRLLNVLENIKEVFNEGNNDNVGMDQLQHESKLIDYEITKYQNRNELTNVGTMYNYKADNLEKRRAKYVALIEELKNYQNLVEDYPELWNKATDEIRTAEEALSSLNNEIEKNEQAIEKNQEAIRQARIKVQNEADKAIRAIIQKEKSMLSATVSIQNTILDTIRNNYREQWDLEKKTIDKKKQALAEEKSLIDERMNLRKKMMDQEAKDEELAELKRQLVLISADTTRTKEANELRRKISEMEKDQAIQDAQDIADAEKKSIEDRSRAWDDYKTIREEDLNDMLANSNNFVEQLNTLLSGSFEDFVAWNAKYNKTYKNSTDEQRKQMEQGWEDTWDNMLGLLRTYWDEVDADMRTKEGFLALLQSTDEYQKLSETGRQSYMYSMSELYDNFTSSLIDNATFEDNHEIIDALHELKDWTFNVRFVNYDQYTKNPDVSDYEYNRNRAAAELYKEQNYEGWGVDAPSPVVYSAPVTSENDNGTGNNSPSSSGSKIWYVTSQGEIGSVKDKTQLPRTTVYVGSSYNEVYAHRPAAFKNTSVTSYNGVYNGSNPGQTSTVGYGNYKTFSMSKDLLPFSEGGLVDYTGLAQVHGTKSRPEAFLDSADTSLLRSMLDAFTYVRNSPYITHLDKSNFGNGGINVGDVNVNLYEAKLENDADYDVIAQKVGNAFTKELQKSGFNLAQYAW